MGTPASLLDLIARGGPLQVGIDQAKDKAAATQALAQAKHAEAAALETQANEAKIRQEVEARKIAMADQGHVSEAYKATGGDPAAMREYLKPRLSGNGLMEWQKHELGLRESAEKLKEHELKNEAITNDRAGQLLSAVAAAPDPAAAYAAAHPQLARLVPGMPPPDKFSADAIPLLMGALGHNKAVLEEAKAKAELKKTQVETANAEQKAANENEQAFFQGVRPDMSQQEYTDWAKSKGMSISRYPSPMAASQAAKVAGVAMKDRAKVAQEELILAGMSPQGITAKDAAELKAKEEEAKQRERQHRESLGVTMRGQDMANERAKEANANRPPTAEESKAYGYYKRMDDAAKVLATMDESMAKKTTFGQAYQNNAPNFMQSEEGQIFNQAKKQFTEAYLRRDSGAAITNGEYVSVDKEYFPQPGDTPATLARKQQARKVAIEAIEKEAGRAISKFDAGGGARHAAPKSFTAFAEGKDGHKIGYSGGKWYDTVTGQEVK